MKVKHLGLVMVICMVLVLPVLADCGCINESANLNWTYPIEEDYTPYNYNWFVQINETPTVNETVIVQNSTPITVQVPDIMEVTGTVEFILKAGGAVMSRDIYLVNDINPNREWEYVAACPDGKSICMTGKSDEFRLIPGNFTAMMPDSNGDHVEYQHFSINVGEHRRVVFLGHAISNYGERDEPVIVPDEETCIPVYVWMVSATDMRLPPAGFRGIFTNENTDTKTVMFRVTYYYLLEPRCYYPQPIYKVVYDFGYEVSGNSNQAELYWAMPRVDGNGIAWELQMLSDGCKPVFRQGGEQR